jgi:nucleoid DNA-binding protein/Flp pilus assembly protein TadD
VRKADVIAEVARRSGLDGKRAALGVEELLEVVKGALGDGETIELRGFGTFKAVASGKRRARNPNTGQVSQTPPRMTPRFLPHQRFKTLVEEHLTDEPQDEAPPTVPGENTGTSGAPEASGADVSTPAAAEAGTHMASAADLAHAAAARGAWPEAVQHYEEAVIGASQDTALRKALGDAYAVAGEHPKAAEQFRAVLAANSRDVQGRTRLASTLWELCDYNAAVGEARRAVEIGPNNAEARFQYGLLLYRKGLYARAAEELQRVAQSDDRTRTHYILGQTYNHLGLYDRAQRALEHALEIQPDDADTCWQLGIIYDKLKRREEALAMYRRANALRAGTEDD